MPHTRDISPRSLRIVATHSAIAGLCPLIPLPYVDDLLIRRVTRRMCGVLYEAHGLHLTPASARALTRAPTHWLRGAATSVALFPVRKLLRKVVYVMAINDCAQVASSVFHDGWLLARLLERGPQARSLEDPRYLHKVRNAMLQTYADINPAPLRRALVGAFLGARVGAEHAVRAVQRLRRGDAAGPGDRVDDLISRMRAAAMGEWRYMDALERSFARRLGLKPMSAGLATSGEAVPAA